MRCGRRYRLATNPVSTVMGSVTRCFGDDGGDGAAMGRMIHAVMMSARDGGLIGAARSAEGGCDRCIAVASSV